MSNSIPPEDPTELVVVEPSVNDVVVTPLPTGGYVATTSPFESVSSLNQQINEAIAAVPENKRGCFLVRANLNKASATLMIRAGDNVTFLARIQKIYFADWAGDISGRVVFLKDPEAEPMSLDDYYRVFRDVGAAFVPNTRFRALIKAVGIHYFNLRPCLDGERWWDSSNG